MKSADKKALKEILASGELRAIRAWSTSARDPLRMLFSLTYDPDPVVGCRAIWAIGKIAASISEQDEERVRNFVRSLLWLMSEESGGIGWRAPEAIAEICVNVPRLSEQYPGLLPQFLQEPSFRPSALTALYRLSPMFPSLVESCRTSVLSEAGDKESFQVYDFDNNTLTNKNVRQLIDLRGEGPLPSIAAGTDTEAAD